MPSALDRWPSLRRHPVSPDLRSRWRSMGAWTDETIGDLLERSATAWPDRIAVITPDADVTFGELQSRSSAIARTLVDAGVRRGDVVCWMLPTGPDAIAVASAIWRVGAVSSPIVPLSGVSELTNIFGQVEPRAIITVRDYRGRTLPDEIDEAVRNAGVPEILRFVVDADVTGWQRADAAGPGTVDARVTPGAPEDPCLILFTSGTESASKAVLHSTAGVHHELRSTISEWGITFRDRMVMASPMTHITGLLQGFLIPARVGAGAVLMEKWDPHQCVDLIEKTQATYMAGAAPFLRDLLAAYRSSGRGESALRQYCCGGAAVTPDLIEGMEEFGVAAYRAWGMTELPTSTLNNELDTLEHRATTDGRPAPGVEVRVLNESGQVLERGEVGELQLRGPEMMLGYVLEEHNERAFTDDGWLRTGDLGSWGVDGFVRISGRQKDIINRGGEKFSAREIEIAVLGHPGVSEVAAIGVPDARLGERIGIAVVASDPGITLDAVNKVLVDGGLSPYKRPEHLIIVDALPTNPTGKVDKKKVAALFDPVAPS